MKSGATPLMPTQLTPVDVLGFVLYVVRCQTGVLGDSGKNPRAEFRVVMKGEDKVRPIRMGERPVRARLALDHPADSLQTRREPAALWWRASCSRRLERDVEELGGPLPVLEAFGDHSERQGLDAGHSFIPILPVAQHAWQSGNLGDPPTVFLAFEFDRESHARNVPSPPGIYQPSLSGRWQRAINGRTRLGTPSECSSRRTPLLELLQELRSCGGPAGRLNAAFSDLA